jgi:hypothetical protein
MLNNIKSHYEYKHSNNHLPQLSLETTPELMIEFESNVRQVQMKNKIKDIENNKLICIVANSLNFTEDQLAEGFTYEAKKRYSGFFIENLQNGYWKWLIQQPLFLSEKVYGQVIHVGKYSHFGYKNIDVFVLFPQTRSLVRRLTSNVHLAPQIIYEIHYGKFIDPSQWISSTLYSNETIVDNILWIHETINEQHLVNCIYSGEFLINGEINTKLTKSANSNGIT